MRFEISEKASQDLESIWLYTAENWSHEQADRYYNLIFDEIEYIAENPLTGRNLNHVRKNYRCTSIKSHLIFYRYRKTKQIVEIIRILHQSMDIDKRLNR